MSFTSDSGLTRDDLVRIADQLRGTDSGLHEHMLAMGLGEYDGDYVYDDLVGEHIIDRCDDCSIWFDCQSLEDGLCVECYEDEFGHPDDFEDDEDDIDLFGFDGDEFLDYEDPLDDEYEDTYFDETDDEDDL